LQIPVLELTFSTKDIKFAAVDCFENAINLPQALTQAKDIKTQPSVIRTEDMVSVCVYFVDS
jgi:hypothetical protein